MSLPESMCEGRPSGCFRALVSALLLIFVAAIRFPGAYSQGLSPQSEIVALLRSGDNERALSFATESLKSMPRDCSLLSLRAIAFTNLQKPELALESFLKALTYCPAYLPALEGAVQIEYARQSPEVVPLLERVLVLRPDEATGHAMLATTLRTQDKCSAALPHYEASKGLFPTKPDLVQGYGFCLAASGNYKAALNQYIQLLSSNPNDTIRYDVALLQWKTKALDDALTTLAPLIAQDRQGSGLAVASKIHEEKGETPQAISFLREAIIRSPDNIDNYLDFAAIAFEHSSFQVGIDMLDVGIQRLPTAAALYVARGVLEVQLSKSDTAIADFEQAHRLDPDLSFATDAVGMMKSQQHRGAESLALFKAQAQQHPDDPLLQYLLAEQLSEVPNGDDGQNLKAAIDAARQATVLDPNYQSAHDLLASLYVRAKEPEMAIQEAEIALTHDSNDQNALYQELMARRRLGDNGHIASLIIRLNEARKVNLKKQQDVDRYRLQDGAP